MAEDKEARIKVYAEALAFFIDEPEALINPTVKLFVELCKEKIALELDKRTKSIGIQKALINVKA